MIISGTGHRPNKLGGYSKENLYYLIQVARHHLLKHNDEVESVISGMALGWDTAIALAAIKLKIPLVAAVPFQGQEKRWPEESQVIYKKILDKASKVVTISKGDYKQEFLQIRNEWMVDNSDLILACWDGTSGGTRNCIRYALKQDKKIENCYETYLKGLI